MNLPRIPLCLALCLAAPLALRASAPSPAKRFNGVPIYQIYEAKDVDNYSRGYYVTSSPNNTVVFGHENGIQTFDGSRWKQILATDATREKIRCLRWIDDEIFAAGYSSVGRLVFNEDATIEYRPLNAEPLSNDASEFYQRIIGDRDFVYFMGTRSVAIYDRKLGTLDSKPFGTWVKDSYLINGTLYVSTDREGLWKLVDGAFVLLPAFQEFVEDRHIAFLDVSPNGQVAFVTENGEPYRIQNEQPVRAFPNFRPERNGEIVDLAFIDDSRLAIAIAGVGINIVDTEGNTVASIDNRFDYRWSAARSLHVDQHGTLWVMLGSNVGKIVANSPISAIDERLRPALEYPAAHAYQGEVYFVNDGKMYRSTHDASGSLAGYVNALPNSPLSIALALPVEDGILVQAERTTYLFRDGALTPLGVVGRLDRLERFEDDPNLFLGVSARRIKLLKRDGMSLQVVEEISHNGGLVNKIAQDPGRVFWLEIGLGRVGKTWLEDGQLKFRLYGADDGVPSDWFAVWKNGSEVIFNERTGVFKYHADKDRFERTLDWEPYFPTTDGSFHRAATDQNGNVWASYGHANYILWRQPDGSYIKDATSLAHMGDVYMNQFCFLPNGDAMLLSADEIFHFDASRRPGVATLAQPPTFVAEISDLDGDRPLYLNDGRGVGTPSLRLLQGRNSISIRLASTRSSALRPPLYQYYLKGFSRDWSKWSNANEIYFTNLDHGHYTLQLRTQIDGAEQTNESVWSFAVPPSPLQTPAAAVAIIAISVALILGAYRYFSRNLKSANEKLERMVAERTQEVERKNAELEKQAEALEAKNLALANQSEQMQANAQELTSALIELHNAQDQLMNTSRKAGMAEVATNVLHNVGNVLNSINVAVLSLADSLEQHRIEKLVRLAELIESHKDDLADFLTVSPRGRAIPEYLKQLSLVLKEDMCKYALEIDSMYDNIEHVKKIIATQQAHAKTVDVFQEIDLPELIDSAIMMIMGDVEHAIFEISRDYEPNLHITSDKHRILQMVANFVKNCKEAIKEASPPLGMININGRYDESRTRVIITIKDNGIGIRKENISQIFTHGFTTKTDGHGFGMHSCANSAKVLGGSLLIESDGHMKGATVTLVLPIEPPRKEEIERTAEAKSHRAALKRVPQVPQNAYSVR